MKSVLYKSLAFTFLLFITFMLTGCDSLFGNNNGSSSNSIIDDTLPILGSDTFSALHISPSGAETPITVDANLIMITDHLEIYLKKGQSMSSSDVYFLANNFELMYPSMIDTYGMHTDVDGNGKVILLLYDINTGNTDYGYVAGFFNRYDLDEDTYDYPSNEAEILYVESQVADEMGNIFATVIHEFQHLINRNVNYFENNRETDLWLNEALSESAEILFMGEILPDDAAMPLGRLSTYTLTNVEGGLHEQIRDGNYFYTWDANSNYVLADYATASLFMYWLYVNNGKDILKDIAQPTNSANAGTYKSVLAALNETSWENIFSDWLEANENPYTGYNEIGKYAYWDDGQVYVGDLDLTSKVYTGNSKNIKLYPGDAVVTASATTGTNVNIVRSNFTLNSGKIFHVTINNDKAVSPYDITDVDSIPVTLSKNIPVTASIQGKVSSLPKMDYTIIPITQGTLNSAGK